MAFTCPRCGRKSHSPDDAREGYCSVCSWWTGDPVLGAIEPPREPPSDTGPLTVVPHLSGEELDVLRIELDVALNRWGETLSAAHAAETRWHILRRIHVINSLRTAFEEARAGLASQRLLGLSNLDFTVERSGVHGASVTVRHLPSRKSFSSGWQRSEIEARAAALEGLAAHLAEPPRCICASHGEQSCPVHAKLDVGQARAEVTDAGLRLYGHDGGQVFP